MQLLTILEVYLVTWLYDKICISSVRSIYYASKFWDAESNGGGGSNSHLQKRIEFDDNVEKILVCRTMNISRTHSYMPLHSKVNRHSSTIVVCHNRPT